jgi:hypothetical protein
MDPAKLMRSLLVGSATLLAVVCMWWLQSKFDGADRKAAVGVVHDYRSRTGWTVPEILDARHPGAHATWAVVTESSCRQVQKITVDVAGVRYEFMVDINGPSIHPGNHESEAVMKQLGEPRPGWPPPGAASGSAASAAPPAPSAP